MKITEELRKELLASKERLERALNRLNSIKDEEEETITLRIPYEAEREDTKTIPQTSLCDLKDGYLYIQDELIGVRWGIAMRTTGPLAEKAFLLNEEYDWELGKDDDSRLCLVPIKKYEPYTGEKLK